MKITLYMRIYLSPEMTDYWSTDVENGLAHPQVTQNMSFQWFQQLQQFLHISKLSSSPLNLPKPIDKKKLQMPVEKVQNKWRHKLEPVILTFQQAYGTYWEPKTTVSLNKMMVKFYACSLYAYKIVKKPIKESYEIWALCKRKYLYNFMFTSKKYGTGKLQKHSKLSLVRFMVLQLGKRLPKTASLYIKWPRHQALLHWKT